MCRCRCATSTNRLPCPSKTFSPSLDAAPWSPEESNAARSRPRKKWKSWLSRDAEESGHGRGDVQEASRRRHRGRQRRPLLRGTEKDDVERGQVVCKPGSITPHTKFKAEAYVLTKEEGGRHTPFFSGYRPQFYFRTTDVTGDMKLPQGVEMVMPGDNVSCEVTLITPVRWRRACASLSAKAATPSAPAPSRRSSSNV